MTILESLAARQAARFEWTPKLLGFWESVKPLGRRRYVLRYGLRLGGILFAVAVLLQSLLWFALQWPGGSLLGMVILNAVVFSALGWLAGALNWETMHRAYDRHQATLPGAGAVPAGRAGE